MNDDKTVTVVEPEEIETFAGTFYFDKEEELYFCDPEVYEVVEKILAKEAKRKLTRKARRDLRRTSMTPEDKAALRAKRKARKMERETEMSPEDRLARQIARKQRRKERRAAEKDLTAGELGGELNDNEDEDEEDEL